MNNKVKKNQLLSMIFLLIFMKPTIIDITPFLSYVNMLYDILRVVLMLIIPALYLYKRHYSINIIIITIFYLVIICSTYTHSGDLRTIVLQFMTIIVCCMFAEMQIERNKVLFIRSFKLILFLYLVFNLITIIMFPNGWYVSGKVNPENWFLGNKNLFIMFIIPYLYLVYEFAVITKQKIRNSDIFGICTAIASCIFSKSSTALAGISVFFLIIFLRTKNNKLINARLGFIVAIVLYILLVVFQLTNIFAFIIVSVFHKDLSLTVRTYVWDSALAWFHSSPLFGVGVQTAEVMESHLFHYAHPHCTYLYYLLFGGVITFTIFIVFLLINADRIDRKKAYEASPAIAAMWSIMIIWLTEVYSRPELLFLVIICSSMLSKEKKIKNLKNI